MTVFIFLGVAFLGRGWRFLAVWFFYFIYFLFIFWKKKDFFFGNFSWLNKVGGSEPPGRILGAARSDSLDPPPPSSFTSQPHCNTLRDALASCAASAFGSRNVTKEVGGSSRTGDTARRHQDSTLECIQRLPARCHYNSAYSNETSVSRL